MCCVCVRMNLLVIRTYAAHLGQSKTHNTLCGRHQQQSYQFLIWNECMCVCVCSIRFALFRSFQACWMQRHSYSSNITSTFIYMFHWMQLKRWQRFHYHTEHSMDIIHANSMQMNCNWYRNFWMEWKDRFVRKKEIYIHFMCPNFTMQMFCSLVFFICCKKKLQQHRRRR